MSLGERFDVRIGAAVLVGLGAVYLVLGLVTGHSASAHSPPDLSAKAKGLDVHRTLALMAKEGEGVVIIDARSAHARALYRLPRSVVAAAAPGALSKAAVGKKVAVVVADKDKGAAKLVGHLSAQKGPTRYHYLAGGAQAWYLALELPVALFSSKKPPFGYAEAMARVRSFLAGKGGAKAEVLAAIGKLKSLGFAPDLLAGKKKPAAGGKKKKITGGCG